MLLPEPPAACPRCGAVPGAPLRPPGAAAVPQGAAAPLPPSPYQGQSPYAYARASDIGNDAGMRMLLPVGRSWWAIAAGYMGLFSLLIFPAPIAIILGIVAIIDIKKHPGKHGMGRAIFGIAMGVLAPVALVAICMIAAARHS